MVKRFRIFLIACCVLGYFASFSNADLVGYYKCNDDISSTTTVINEAYGSWGDATAGFDGGSDLWGSVDGMLGDAFEFADDGTTRPGIDTDGQISATGDFTLAGWAKVSADPTNRCFMFGQYINTSAGRMYLLASDNSQIGSGKARFGIFGNSSGTVDLLSDNALDDGQWHFIAATRDGDTFTLYVDGVAEDIATVSDISICQTSDLCIGNLSDILAQRITTGGTYDELKVYDHALSAIDIALEYRNGLLQQYLVAHYSCEDILIQTGDYVINTAISEDSWGDAIASFDGGSDLYSGVGGILNEAFEFVDDGTTRPGIDTDGKLSATGDFTLTGWAKVPEDPNNRCFMFGQYYGSSVGRMYLLASDRKESYKARFGIFGDPNSTVDLLSEDALDDGKWHFIAVTRDDDTFTLYVDGVVEDSNSTSGISICQSSDLCVGNLSDISAQRILTGGTYDELKVYSCALTVEEIQCYYQQGVGFIAINPSPYDGQTRGVDQATWTLSWDAPSLDGFVDFECDVYLDDDPDLSDATLVLSDSNLASVSVSLNADTTYYWRVDYHDTAGTEVLTGDVWTFDTVTSYATELYPLNGSKGLNKNVNLRWVNGFDYDNHKIYISDSSAAVQNRTVTPITSTANVEYVTGLNSSTTYYWAVDEVVGSTTYSGNVQSFTVCRDLQSSTWMGFDDLGFAMPDYDECGSPRENRTVGLFYFIWHDDCSGPVYNITELIDESPSDPNYGPKGAFHYWAEPELGYYKISDPYVLRRHASMLSDAGVDVVFFDIGNGYVYTSQYMKLCQVWQQMRDEGERTPQICFQVFTNPSKTVQRLYDELYSKNLYSDLWFYWKGKPLVLAPLTPSDSSYSSEVQNFFTMRYSWAWKWGQYTWNWLDHYPQHYGYDTDSTVPEQTSVCIAQHSTSATPNCIGRSFSASESWGGGTMPTLDEYKLSGTEDLGIYFDKQWQRALELDPDMIFITGWNEWIAQRFVSTSGNNYFLGDALSVGDTFFVDQYNQEYSRDAEPMKDGHTDNYYYQMLASIRKYKGVPQPTAADDAKSITIDGYFTDWENVNLAYYDTYNDTVHRDYDGWADYHYTDTTGRNDIVECKVAFNDYKIYFYVETADDLTSYTDPNWMMLFIDADQDITTGWEGYDYLVNHSRTSTTVSLEKCLGGWNWELIENVPYSYSGKQLELSVLSSCIGQDSDREISFDFHWADNIQKEGDILEFAKSGDSAPNRRLNYRYEKNNSQYSADLLDNSGFESPVVSEDTVAHTVPTDWDVLVGSSSSVYIYRPTESYMPTEGTQRLALDGDIMVGQEVAQIEADTIYLFDVDILPVYLDGSNNDGNISFKIYSNGSYITLNQTQDFQDMDLINSEWNRVTLEWDSTNYPQTWGKPLTLTMRVYPNISYFFDNCSLVKFDSSEKIRFTRDVLSEFMSVSENGSIYTFDVELLEQPSSNVSIAVEPDNSQIDLGEGAGEDLVLTFTTSNWDVPQTVVVSAVDDSAVENITFSKISFSVDSSDLAYDIYRCDCALTPAEMEIKVVDDDSDTSYLYNGSFESPAPTAEGIELRSVPDGWVDMYYRHTYQYDPVSSSSIPATDGNVRHSLIYQTDIMQPIGLLIEPDIEYTFEMDVWQDTTGDARIKIACYETEDLTDPNNLFVLTQSGNLRTITTSGQWNTVSITLDSGSAFPYVGKKLAVIVTTDTTNLTIDNGSVELERVLVGDYSFEDDLTASTTVENSATGSSWPDATAVIVSPCLNSGIDGRSNDAFEFSDDTGNSSCIDTNGKISATGDFTLAGWAKVSSAPTNRCFMFGQYYGSSAGRMYLLASDKNVNYKARFGIFGNSSGTVDLLSDNALDDGQWHFIAVTRDGDTFTLYVDGVAEDNATVTNVSVCQSTDLCIGNLADTSGERIATAGIYDEITVRSRALTDAQIDDIYQKQSVIASYSCEDDLTSSTNVQNTTEVSDWPDATAVPVGSYLTSGVTGYNGDAFEFVDNSNNSSCIDTNGKISATGDFTLSGWAKVSAEPTNRCFMFGQYMNTSAGRMYLLASDKLSPYNYKARFGIFGNSSGTVDLLSNNALDDGQWHFIAVTRDGDTFTLYIDGVAEDNTTLTDVSVCQATDLCIGNLSDVSTGRIATAGIYDELSIRDKALTASQISALYAQ